MHETDGEWPQFKSELRREIEATYADEVEDLTREELLERVYAEMTYSAELGNEMAMVENMSALWIRIFWKIPFMWSLCRRIDAWKWRRYWAKEKRGYTTEEVPF